MRPGNGIFKDDQFRKRTQKTNMFDLSTWRETPQQQQVANILIISNELSRDYHNNGEEVNPHPNSNRFNLLRKCLHNI